MSTGSLSVFDDEAYMMLSECPALRRRHWPMRQGFQPSTYCVRSDFVTAPSRSFSKLPMHTAMMKDDAGWGDRIKGVLPGFADDFGCAGTVCPRFLNRLIIHLMSYPRVLSYMGRARGRGGPMPRCGQLLESRRAGCSVDKGTRLSHL